MATVEAMSGKCSLRVIDADATQCMALWLNRECCGQCAATTAC